MTAKTEKGTSFTGIKTKAAATLKTKKKMNMLPVLNFLKAKSNSELVHT